MVLRFANGIFEPLWNRAHIDHVQITAAETVGVEGRGSFYEATGALRDMVPNHLFQLLAMTAMEPPNSFDADAVRTEKAKVIEAIHHLTPERGPVQRRARAVRRPARSRGQQVEGLPRRARRGARQPTTETYVALQAADRQLALGRRAVLPAHRQGACRPARTEIAIRFKQVPCALFRDGPRPATLTPNILVLHIQPDEGVSLALRGQGAGAGGAARRGRHGLPLRRLFQRRAQHRLRDAALRLHDRRRDAVPARRQHRGRLARGAAVPRCLGQGPGEVHGYAAGSWGPAAGGRAAGAATPAPGGTIRDRSRRGR